MSQEIYGNVGADSGTWDRILARQNFPRRRQKLALVRRVRGELEFETVEGGVAKW